MKFLIGIALISMSGVVFSAPYPDLPMMASRANCWAVSPVGVGYHNESVSWYMTQTRRLYVHSEQRASNIVRGIDSAFGGYRLTMRAYAGLVFPANSTDGRRYWNVTGHHHTQFSLMETFYRQTKATTCNLSQGWPWS